MNKIKLFIGKCSLITVISLAFMFLGIGLISWTLFSMGAHSDYFDDSTLSSRSIPTTFSWEPNKLIGVSTVTMESVPFILFPSSIKALYTANPNEGDNIGSLTIPALKRKIPIIQGTNVNDLENGVGHFIQSVLPGEEDNCVFSGHRDTVFRQIGDLKIGDQLIVQTSAGAFEYEVNGTRIVHEDDKTVIVPSDHAILTMTTCYPFYAIGNAPDRYIVSADLVKNR
jgi:sortase A